MSDTNTDILRESLRGYVDSNLAGLKSNANGNAYDPAAVAKLLHDVGSYYSNGGNGDVLQVGKKSEDQLRQMLGPNADKVLGAMKGMYNDQALVDWGHQNGIDPSQFKSPDELNAALAQKGYAGSSAESSPWLWKDRQAQADEQAKKDSAQNNLNDINSKLKAYADRMMTYDPNDPTAKAVANLATQQAQNQAAGAGTSSARGLGAYNNASLMNDAATRYQTQREQAGTAAYQNLGAQAQQGIQFDKGLDFQIGQYNNQLSQQAYASQQQQRQGVGAAIGGAVGGVGGGLVGGLVSGGNPAAIAQGVSIGSGLGSGVGAGTAGLSQGAYKPQPYSYGRSNTRFINT